MENKQRSAKHGVKTSSTHIRFSTRCRCAWYEIVSDHQVSRRKGKSGLEISRLLRGITFKKEQPSPEKLLRLIIRKNANASHVRPLGRHDRK